MRYLKFWFASALSCKNFLYSDSLPELMATFNYVVDYCPFDSKGQLVYGSVGSYRSVETVARETLHEGVSVNARSIDGNPFGMVFPGSQGSSSYVLLRYSVVEGIPEVRAEASVRDLSDKLREKEIVHEVRQLTSRVVASWPSNSMPADPVEPVFQGEGIA